MSKSNYISQESAAYHKSLECINRIDKEATAAIVFIASTFCCDADIRQSIESLGTIIEDAKIATLSLERKIATLDTYACVEGSLSLKKSPSKK